MQLLTKHTTEKVVMLCYGFRDPIGPTPTIITPGHLKLPFSLVDYDSPVTGLTSLAVMLSLNQIKHYRSF